MTRITQPLQRGQSGDSDLHARSAPDAPDDDAGTWLGQPVTRWAGRLSEIRAVVPSFDRRPFQLQGIVQSASLANPDYDAVVRLPTIGHDAEIPVGVVSRRYRLIQHRDLLDQLYEALERQKILPDTLEGSISLTPHGERMAVSVTLPDEPRFRYALGTDDSMGFRVQCFNSVDGSTKFMMAMGWLRFVCSNGLVAGKTLASVRRSHTPQFHLNDVVAQLDAGFAQAERDQLLWDRWREERVSEGNLRRWIDGQLRETWGVKAAARTFAICMTGADVCLSEPFEKAQPSERSIIYVTPVPGAPKQFDSAFDVAQALSWVAGAHREFSRTTEATREIPKLVEQLIRGQRERLN